MMSNIELMQFCSNILFVVGILIVLWAYANRIDK